MLRIGLTGGIGSGKSTVSALLAERGAVVVDADRIAREVVEPGTPGLQAVVAEFGTEVLGPDGALDRPALAAVVFADPAARARLDGIVHPLVRARATELVAAAPPDAVVVQDVPLLVETGQAGSYDLVLVVEADPEARVRRLVGRGLSEEDARARTSGCTMPSSRRRASGSANTTAARAGRSRAPSGVSTSWPNAATTASRPGVPGSTTSRAMRSASTIRAPRAASSPATVLLPDPIPPVSPMRSTHGQ